MQPLEYQPGVNPPALGSDQTPPGLLARLSQLFSGGDDQPAGPVDPYSDTKAILKFVEECKKESLENRWVYERSWWRIILYILSRQWIYYDRKRGQWLDKRMAKWIPRPVTNMVQVALNTIKTVFQAIQLATTAKPLTADADAVGTAETVDKLEPLIAEEHGMKGVMREFDFWFIALGNCVLQTGWNPDANTRIEQYQECQNCGGQYTQAEVADMGPTPMCQECGSPEFDGAVDAHGYPVGDTKKTGAGFTDVLSPFEYATPSVHTRLKDSPLIIRLRWRTKKFCLDTYGKDQCKGITWGKMPQERSLQLLRAIAQQSEIASTPITYGGDEGSGEGVAEYELWHRPTTLYPHGLVARVLGDSSPVLVEKEDEGLPGPLPYRTQDGTPLFPFMHGVYEDLGGRMNGRGALEVVLNKNDQLNQLDSMAQLCEQRMANPVWLEPKGAEVKSFTGEPGLVVKYNPNVAGGNAKPERIPGANIPNSLFTRRDQIKADIEELVGTYDVLKGQKPAGIDAFSALNLLKEMSESRFGPAMAARAEVYRGWYKLAIEIERQFGPEERIKAAMRPNRSWTFQKFKKANLTGAIDIIVEDGSQLPKTALGKRAAIEHGKNLGVLNVMDPEQAYEVMREIGISHLAPSVDASMKAALREQTLFASWVQTIPAPVQPGMSLITPEQREMAAPQPQEVPVPAAPGGPDDQGGGNPAGGPVQTITQLVPQPAAQQQAILFPGNPLKVRPWDKHLIHVVQHDIFCQGDEALDIFGQFPDLEELWGLHRQAHLEAAAEEAMQQAMMQGAVPGAPAGAVSGPPAQGAAKSLENSNQNSGHGNPHAHKHAAGSPQSPQATSVM